MPLKLKILEAPRMNGFEARIEVIPEGAGSATSGPLVWSAFFDTEEDAREVGQKKLKELRREE